jgi:hypothetical protein
MSNAIIKSLTSSSFFEMKMSGKPYVGELHVRFDEGEQDFVPWTILNEHKVGNDS